MNRFSWAVIAAVALAAVGCSGVGDSSDCSPSCTGGEICCVEPTHQTVALPDGGSARSAPVCVAPSHGACPALP